MNPDAPTPDAQLTAPVSLLAGRYQLLDKLGEGGMGAVFHARDTQLDRHVAVKLLPANSVHDAGAVARFRREAKALAHLSHPGIIQAFDHGADGDRHFLVMEFVEGRSLAAVLRQQGRVGPARAADFTYQAALALHHAHKGGLVHRDVKPSNLLLSADGRVRLLDLGLARFLQDQIGDAGLTREGAGLGTPDYCPPEQFRDAHHADPSADVYSLGCTLYQLIAGRVPFPGSSFSEKAQAHERREPTPLEELCPDMPAGLALTVRKMMAKRPADRFQSMAEVAEALMPHVASSSASFPQIRRSATWDGSRLATMPVMPRRRRRVALAVAGAVLSTLLVAGAVFAVGFAAGWFRPAASPVVLGDGPSSTETGRAKPPEEPPGPGEKEEKSKPADDPNVLTVSREEKDGGKYRTIGDALKAVKPGQTIRVVDSATYQEPLAVINPTTHKDIVLEAVRGATLAVPAEGGIAVHLHGVAGVTVRGFHLRGSGGRIGLVLAERVGPGVVLEDLDLELPHRAFRPEDLLIGIDVESNRVAAGSPLVVRRCRFRGGHSGVQLLDANGDSSGVILRENEFTDVLRGVLVRGTWGRVAVVGNSIRGGMCAIQLEMLGEKAADLLLANNTFVDGTYAIRLADSDVRGGVSCRNNLMLNRGRPDIVYMQFDGRSEESLRPGNGATVVQRWQLTHNWREVAEPLGDSRDEKACVPLGSKEVRRSPIDGVNRDPKSPDFLRPDPKSPLATDGASQEDPSLPRYVGALPPEGTEPWDWDRSWRMPKGASLLTVSKDSKDGGTYRTINAALKDAGLWATIRVLDAETYAETISLTDRKKYEGLTLEAVGGATLLLGKDITPLIAVEDVPRVRIAGFKLTDVAGSRDVNRAFVVVSGNVPGVALTRLEMIPKAPLRGVSVENATGSPEEPLRIEKCSIRPVVPVSNDGIGVIGNLDGEPAANICLRGNRIVACVRGINLHGALRDIHVTGNLVIKSRDAGLQVENLAPASRGLLIANNTAFTCGNGFRVWDDPPYKAPRPGQVEVANNLLFKAASNDAAYVLSTGKDQEVSPGDGKELLKAWRFRHNGRDFSGAYPATSLPAAPEDTRVKRDDLLSAADNELDRVRPGKDSPLATQGAGTKDDILPAYIGALPPGGTEPWDWDRTWRARVKKAEDKK
jgi:hypothetical protein